MFDVGTSTISKNLLISTGVGILYEVEYRTHQTSECTLTSSEANTIYI